MRDKEFNDFVSELQSEIDNYKNDTLKLSKNQIYDNSYEIQAMENLCGYLMNDGQKYRRSDFPKDKMESLSEYAYQLLQSILSIGLFVSHQGIDIKTKNQATDFLYKALFQVGNTNKQNPLFYENYSLQIKSQG